MSKLNFILIFMVLNFVPTLGQNSLSFWNEFTKEINRKVDIYNAIGESVSEYNRRIYQFYIKGDSLSFKEFRLKNTFGYLNLNYRQEKRLNKQIQKSISGRNVSKLSELFQNLRLNENKIIKKTESFSIYQEYNFRRDLDSTNAKFAQIKTYFGEIEQDLKEIRNIVEQNTSNSIDPKFNEFTKLSVLTKQAYDSIRYGTIASTHLISKNIGNSISKLQNLNDFDSIRVSNFKSSLDVYYLKKQLLNFNYFIKPYYFNSTFIEQKTKIQNRFYNHLVHLLATNKSNSESFIDWYNNKLIINNSENLYLQKPMVIFDPLVLTQNNGFGLNRIIMPKSFTIILLDVSGSMNKERRLERCKDALKSIISEKGDKDYFCVIAFSRFSTQLFKPEEKDKMILNEKINSIRTFDETNPELAIENATSLLKQYPVSRFKNRVILITDGNFTITEPMYKYMYQIKAKNAKFSLVLIKGDKDLTESNKFNELTEINDGKIYFVEKSESILQKLQNEKNRD